MPPDSVTFVGVLSACARVVALEEGMVLMRDHSKWMAFRCL